jgi:drug/metabolite transporter (DMT)-like permease
MLCCPSPHRTIGAMDTAVAGVILVSAVLHASWNFATRAVKGNLAVLWLSLALSGVASMPVAIVWIVLHPPQAESWLILLISSILNAVFFSLLGKAYEKGEISLVYPVARGTGVAGAAMIAMGLGLETIHPLAGAGIAAVCVGILLIGLGHNGDSQGSKLHAVVLAVLTGASVACYSILDKIGVGGMKEIGLRGMHPIIYVSGQYLGTALFMIPYAWPRTKGKVLATWKAHPRHVAFIGSASLVTYLLILYVYPLGPASSIIAFREVAVVLGCLLGFLVLKERLTVRKVLGIAAIVAGLVLIKVGR